jgi:hypothetical protein
MDSPLTVPLPGVVRAAAAAQAERYVRIRDRKVGGQLGPRIDPDTCTHDNPNGAGAERSKDRRLTIKPGNKLEHVKRPLDLHIPRPNLSNEGREGTDHVARLVEAKVYAELNRKGVNRLPRPFSGSAPIPAPTSSMVPRSGSRSSFIRTRLRSLQLPEQIPHLGGQLLGVLHIATVREPGEAVKRLLTLDALHLPAKPLRRLGGGQPRGERLLRGRDRRRGHESYGERQASAPKDTTGPDQAATPADGREAIAPGLCGLRSCRPRISRGCF